MKEIHHKQEQENHLQNVNIMTILVISRQQMGKCSAALIRDQQNFTRRDFLFHYYFCCRVLYLLDLFYERTAVSEVNRNLKRSKMTLIISVPLLEEVLVGFFNVEKHVLMPLMTLPVSNQNDNSLFKIAPMLLAQLTKQISISLINISCGYKAPVKLF